MSTAAAHAQGAERSENWSSEALENRTSGASENYWFGPQQNPTSTTSQNLTFAAARNSETTEGGKAFATLQAEAALKGFRLDRIETDAGAQAFIVTRWALTKELATLDAVRDFLQQVGGAHG